MKKRQANPAKASKIEAKGDRLLAKGKLKRALKKYKKALEHNPAHKGIYDKLMETRDKLPGNWKMEDFIESVDWAMQKQEQEIPSMRQVHARLSPEWKKASDLALKILAEGEQNRSETFIEELVAMGEIGTRATIGLLLEIKAGAGRKETIEVNEP